MRKYAFIFLLLLVSANMIFAQERKKPALSDEKSFSMIIIPDPQSYTKFDKNQPLFDLMTAWVADNIERLNIKTALCTGDLVEFNEELIPHGTNGNQTSREQWEAASKAFARLDNKLPYVICTGNHDYGYVSAENRMSNLSKYFYPERNPLWRKTLVSAGLNAFDIPTLENAAYEFITNTWEKILIISLEFDPRDEAIEWAKKTIENDRFKNHKVILLTHSYMNINGKRIAKEAYKITPVNYGEDIWEKLIYPSENIFMVICGHAAKQPKKYDDTVSFRVDKNAAGKNVHQMMFNAQTADGFWDGNGGDGWLRILEFLPDGKTIKVQTYSPLFGISPKTENLAWRTESFDEFDIIVDF